MCAECEAAVLQLHDFEEIITYLKVLSWTESACAIPSACLTVAAPVLCRRWDV